MASKSPEDKVEFVLKALATCDEFKPNYSKLKDALGINTNANAQRQFKSIVEAGKLYTLESSGGQTRVVDNSNGSAVVAKPTKPKKRTKKDSTDGEAEEEEKPKKKPSKPKAKKEEVIESEVENDDE